MRAFPLYRLHSCLAQNKASHGPNPFFPFHTHLLLESISHLSLFASNPPTDNQNAVQGISRRGKWGNRPPRMRPQLPRCHHSVFVYAIMTDTHMCSCWF